MWGIAIIYIYRDTQIYLYTYIHAHTDVYVYVYIYIHRYTYTYTCICVYVDFDVDSLAGLSFKNLGTEALKWKLVRLICPCFVLAQCILEFVISYHIILYNL